MMMMMRGGAGRTGRTGRSGKRKRMGEGLVVNLLEGMMAIVIVIVGC